MKRNTYFLCLLCVLFASATKADVLTDILQGAYAPTTLSICEQDSILGNTSPNRYRLEYTDKQQVFRHSFFANYTIVDTQKNTRKPLSNEPVRDAIISPNGKYIAFVKADRNIYLHKLDYGTEVAVTAIPQDQWCYNGIADWLYEEEFGLTCMMAFSPDSKQLAFVRIAAAQVPATSWQLMLTDNYPTTIEQPYPRAGMPNGVASVHVYTIATKDTHTIQPDIPYAEFYIPRILWRTVPSAKGQPDQSMLVMLVLNRDQNDMQVLSCSPLSLQSTVLYSEQSDQYYVDYSLFDQWQWLSSGQFIVLSEKEGWRKLYLHSPQGLLVRPLPMPTTMQHEVEVMNVYGFVPTTQTLYLQVAFTPSQRTCVALNIKKGTAQIVGPDTGWNSLRLSQDGQKVLLAHESDTEPVDYTLIFLPKGTQQRVANNDSLRSAWEALQLPPKQFQQIDCLTDAEPLEACIFYPPNFDATKQYPVVLLQYSGPASQRVTDTWRRKWDYALADLGFVVVIADPRGSDAKGRAWRNHSYMHLGREAYDQLAVLQWISHQSFTDPHRIAMIGWSYGGYETLQCMTLQPLQADGTPLISKGIAIAPVTDWRLYDSAYTERYMRRPQVNEAGYDEADVTRRASNLKGDLLIVHGNADDNVHVQHTWIILEALIDADKDYQMLVYPDDNHFLRNNNHYIHLHKQLLHFLNK